jgi:H/ACA ribonucleoprotein complex subunit 3
MLDEELGQLIAARSQFWMGPEFGFGFYVAGQWRQPFIVESRGSLLNEAITITLPPGHLLDMKVAFAADRFWLLFETRRQGRPIRHLHSIGRRGDVLATRDTESESSEWLWEVGEICAAGNFLFATSDRGIWRIEANGLEIARTREFPATVPFVTSECSIHLAEGGFYIVNGQEIRHLEMK